MVGAKMVSFQQSKFIFIKEIMNLKIIITLLVLSQLIFSQQRKISGMVKDSIGEAIAGANIVIEGTNRGTNTGIDGKYSIKVYPNEFLVFSFVGKKNQRISADKNEINIQLIDNGIKIIEVLPYTPHINKKEKTNFVNVEKNSLSKKKSEVLFLTIHILQISLYLLLMQLLK